MAAHQYAEKLILLDLHVNGLFCRVHDMINFKKRLAEDAKSSQGSTSGPLLTLLDNDLAKFITALVKKFPDPPANLENIPGYDVFHKQAPAIMAGLKEYYETFLDIMHFKNSCWDVLTQCCKNFTEFKFDVNRYMMTKFMDLFVKFSQLLILTARIPDRRSLLILYAQAHNKVTGNTESSFPGMADFLTNYENPIVRLREECKDLTDRLSATCMALQGPIMTWSNNISNFHTKSVFNILDDPNNMAVSNKEKEYQELMHLETFQNWMVYVFLICPAGLQTEGSISILMICLKEMFQAVVFRDETLDIHHEFHELFKTYQVKKAGAKAFKLSNYKKQLQEAQADVQSTVEHHKKLRVYLQCEMDTMLHFFTEFPGCIAPKMSMILAATNLARNCVVWYFRHKDAVPFKKPKTYQFHLDPAGVATLIKLVHCFKTLVLEHESYIQSYYKDLVQDDTKAVQELWAPFKTDTNLAPLMIQLGDSILEQAAAGDTGNYESVRLNWYRVSAGIFHVASGVTYQTAVGLCARFITMVNHTRCVDLLQSQLRSCSSFLNLLWHPEQVKELFAQAPADTLLDIANTMADALHNVQRLGSEEARYIVAVSQNMAHDLCVKTMETLKSAVSTIQQETGNLRGQTSFNQVIAKMQQPNKPLAGFESTYANRKMDANVRLRRAKQTVAQVCSSVSQWPMLNVCLLEFFPFEYMRDHIISSVSRDVRNILYPPDRKICTRPSVALSKIRDTFYAFQAVEQFVNLNVSDIFREVMFGIVASKKHGGPADMIPEETTITPAGKDDLFIKVFALHYVQLFRNSIIAGGNPFSETLMTFVNHAESVDTESYTTPEELRALCELVGPYGVRAIDAHLLKVISDEVAKIKQVLVNNQTVLTPLVGKSMYAENWSSAVSSISQNDKETLAMASSLAGCVLKFRQTLRMALGQVVKARTPFIFEPVKAAHAIVHDVEKSSTPMQALDLLAMDCGISAGESDFALRTTLAKFKANSADDSQWALLPEMFGVAFKSDFWRRAQYMVSLDGHNNNAHCMDECIVELVVNLNRIGATSTTAADDKIRTDLERFVQCSSYSVLHLLKSNNTRDPGIVHAIPHIMMFIEMFISRTNGRVKLAFLEHCFPYTLLRTNYIQLYERQTMGTAYQAADTNADEEKKSDVQQQDRAPSHSRTPSAVKV